LEARIIPQQIEHRIEPEHEPHVITVTGKAFYDIGHAPADHSNRRSTPKGYTVWEIIDGCEPEDSPLPPIG